MRNEIADSILWLPIFIVWVKITVNIYKIIKIHMEKTIKEQKV